MSASEATDKLAQQIKNAPDKVANLIDKYGGKSSATSGTSSGSSATVAKDKASDKSSS